MEIRINLGPRSEQWNQQSRVLGHAVIELLRAVVKVNLFYMKLHHVPPLYQSNVRYAPEPKGTTEEFATIPVILARGKADCDDLAPWRVAELQAVGEKADIRLQWKKNPRTGQRMYHVVVRRGDGRIEDPSALLGMHRVVRSSAQR